jgi:short-subunit dehydrogenase
MTIAIVTGASSGIGKEFFLSLNERADGLDEIWVVARRADKLDELKSLTPVPVRAFPLDLSLPESADALAQALEKEKPQIKYLILASGFGRFAAVADEDLSVLQNMIDLNCKAVVALTKHAAPYMQRGGTMILIASVAAMQPIPYIATYAASKAFVLSYGRAFNRELYAQTGARCTCVCPFWTKTAFFERAIVNGEKSAQIMLVMGTDSYYTHPNWEKNLSIALKLQAVMEKTHDGSTRPLDLRKQRFNQDLAAGAIIAEVGAAGNTHREALNGVSVLAEAIILLAKGAN